MDPVQERPILPNPNSGPHYSILAALLQALYKMFAEYGFRLNRVLPLDGTEAMTAPLVLMTYTTATRPTAASWTGGTIYVSDGAAGQKFQGSDGTAWVFLG